MVTTEFSGKDILLTTGASGGCPGGGSTTLNSRYESGSDGLFEIPRLFVAITYTLCVPRDSPEVLRAIGAITVAIGVPVGSSRKYLTEAIPTGSSMCGLTGIISPVI